MYYALLNDTDKFVSVIQQSTNWCAENDIKWYIAVMMTND